MNYRMYRIENYPPGSVRYFVLCPNGKRKEFPTRESAQEFLKSRRRFK